MFFTRLVCNSKALEGLDRTSDIINIAYVFSPNVVFHDNLLLEGTGGKHHFICIDEIQGILRRLKYQGKWYYICQGVRLSK